MACCCRPRRKSGGFSSLLEPAFVTVFRRRGLRAGPALLRAAHRPAAEAGSCKLTECRLALDESQCAGTAAATARAWVVRDRVPPQSHDGCPANETRPGSTAASPARYRRHQAPAPSCGWPGGWQRGSRTEYCNNSGQCGLSAGTHVHGFSGELEVIDANHWARPRIKHAQPSGSDAGHFYGDGFIAQRQRNDDHLVCCSSWYRFYGNERRQGCS
jgi:hypothetical protein